MQNDTPTASLHGEQSHSGPPANPQYTNGNGVEFDFNDLSIQTPNHEQTFSPSERSNHVPQLNNLRNSATSNGTQSNRTSLGMIYSSGYDSNGYATSTGQVTPDSVTTSGVATPYTFTHEARSTPISPDEALHAQLLAAFPRAPTYNYTSLPHVVGDLHGRGDDSGWSNYHLSHNNSYNHSTHHSGTNTPLHRETKPIDFSTVPPEDFSRRRF